MKYTLLISTLILLSGCSSSALATPNATATSDPTLAPDPTHFSANDEEIKAEVQDISRFDEAGYVLVIDFLGERPSWHYHLQVGSNTFICARVASWPPKEMCIGEIDEDGDEFSVQLVQTESRRAVEIGTISLSEAKEGSICIDEDGCEEVEFVSECKFVGELTLAESVSGYSLCITDTGYVRGQHYQTDAN